MRESDRRVLVVGTTADYVDLITRRMPDRALFLTDRGERARSAFPPPPPPSELLVDLSHPESVPALLAAHVHRSGLALGGATSFDDESMALTAVLAGELGLRYAGSESVSRCRDKFACNRAWRSAGVDCPRSALVCSGEEAAEQLPLLNGPGILKPLTGSGSELVFRVEDGEQCRLAARTALDRLAGHTNVRMYGPPPGNGDDSTARRCLVLEECVAGPEYSADFAIEDGMVEVLRIARKIPALGEPFGTTLAYVMPGELPPELPVEELGRVLAAGATALGIDFGLCMVDFIVRDGQPCLLELAPRPGGDCLPPLQLRSGGLDMLGLALEFAAVGSRALPEPTVFRPMVGLRLIAGRAGTIESVSSLALRNDPRVKEIYFKFEAGHQVVLPPEDYDSRILGHIIFVPPDPAHPEHACAELAAGIAIEWSRPPCRKSTILRTPHATS